MFWPRGVFPFGLFNCYLLPPGVGVVRMLAKHRAETQEECPLNKDLPDFPSEDVMLLSGERIKKPGPSWLQQ